jgi:outer membrane protein TolC
MSPLLLTLALATSGAAPWWSALGDARLSAAVDEALTNNGDLDAARLRASALDAGARMQLSPILPTVSFDVGGNVAPLDSLGFQFGGLGGGAAGGAEVPLPAQLASSAKEESPLVYYTGSAMLSGRVQLDLGRTWMGHDAAKRDATAARHDRDAQALSVAQQVARTYYDLVAARAQVALVEQQIATNKGVLDVIELRFRSGGSASGLDVLQQRQNLAQTQTLLPSARANVRALEQQLAMLLGRESGEAPPTAGALPDVGPPPTLDDVAAMIEERPDVRAARERIEAASSRQTAAWLGFLPTFGLSAQAGQQAILIDEPNTQPVWGAGATLSVPLYVGGQRFASLDQASRSADAARAQLRQLRLRADQGARSALERENGLREQLAASQRQLEAAQLALDKSKERYVSGLASYQAVQIALNTTLGSRLTLLNTQRQLVDARLRLLDALGGTWTNGVGAPGRRQ